MKDAKMTFRCGSRVQMLCSPSCYGKIIDVCQQGDDWLYQVRWEDGPVQWYQAEGLVCINVGDDGYASGGFVNGSAPEDDKMDACERLENRS
jgi:hypothetical protein